MSITNVVTRGFGPSAAIKFVTTRGYLPGAAPSPPPPPPPPSPSPHVDAGGVGRIGPAFPRHYDANHYRSTLAEYRRKLGQEQKEAQAAQVAELERQIEQIEVRRAQDAQRNVETAAREYRLLSDGVAELAIAIDEHKRGEQAKEIEARVADLIRYAELTAAAIKRRDDDEAIIAILSVI